MAAFLAVACATPEPDRSELAEAVPSDAPLTSEQESELRVCVPEPLLCLPFIPCCGDAVCHYGFCVEVDRCKGVTCTALDECHEAGTCDPSTGVCSNPIKEDGAQCDDDNACTQSDVCSSGLCGGAPYSCPPPQAPDDCHVGVCNGDGTCGVANVPDGEACCGLLPAERCVGEYHGTCSAGACTNINSCGNGFIELLLGESCDDGNTTAGDGCDASCQVEPFETTPPIKISAELSCTTAVANAARKIAVDGSGTIYAVMLCGGVAHVAVSVDRGRSFTAPLDLSSALGGSVIQAAVATGPTGVAYAAMMINNGQVFLRTSTDRGATWSSAALIGGAAAPNAGLSLAAFNDDLYIGFRVSSGISVARNHSRGAGPFETTLVTMNVTFFDLLFDVRLGTLAVVADTPAFHVRISQDAGVTFAAEVAPPGSQFFSDWAIGNGTIFVSGTALSAPNNSTGIFLINSARPTGSTFLGGLPSVSASQTRSVSADDLGNAFVASQLNSGGVQLDRLPVGSFAFDASRLLDPAGGSPVAGPLPGGAGAAVIYTVGTSVWATVQAY